MQAPRVDGEAMKSVETRALRNRTIQCEVDEYDRLEKSLFKVNQPVTAGDLTDRIIWGDIWKVAAYLPEAFADLLILDPPYNLSKNYNGREFRRRNASDYAQWFEDILLLLKPSLKPQATVYVCSDWKSSLIIGPILSRHFRIHNRITWERDKGRGSHSNWKNNSEDVWFCTVNEDYYFDISSVKMKRKVIAPYRSDGVPKDWTESEDGNFRITFPSNLWTDITVPFWSMPENTDHPTQKPEKLIAKLILASSPPRGLVFDPFLGSGTSAVVARKLGRHFCGIEIDRQFSCWGLKRLEMAQHDSRIQGYHEGIFWERNSLVSKAKISRQSFPQGEMFI